MSDVESFLEYLQSQFRELESALINILKEEESLHDDVLVKKGFIIHSFSINYRKIDFDVLDNIISYLERILKQENHLHDELERHSASLEVIEEDYYRMNRKKLHTDILEKNLKEAFYYCRLMITRIKQVKALLKDEGELHKKSLPEKTEIFFASFEHVANKILRFIRFSEQLVQRVSGFEKESYYAEPRTYGRVMSSDEYKKTIAKKKLCSSKDPIPVFDAPRKVRERILALSKDELKNFFGQIGVAAGAHVIFFQTRLKPFNHDKPIPQSNGLREYKFPKGENIDLLKAA